MNRDCFDRRQFTDPGSRREGSLSENKRDIYLLKKPKRASNEEINRVKKEKPEFLRDLIAIANAARQRGKPAYLRFGMVDENYEIVGVKGQCANGNVTPERFSQEKIHEFNQDTFVEILNEYVGPVAPVFNYCPGEVDGKQVCYLEIIPVALAAPYQVKQNLDEVDVRHSLSIGQCWVRQGTGKHKPIPEDQKQFIYAWKQVPYVEWQQWRTYLDKSVYLTSPRPPKIGCQTLYANTGLTLEDEVKQFLADTTTSLLVISGAAGCGKSAFLGNMFRRYASNLLQEVELTDYELIDFQNPIPIFLCLNNFTIQPGESFGRKLLQRMAGYNDLGLYRGEEPEKIFRDESKQWIIFLDAFDEANLDRGNRASLWDAIYSVVDLYPNVQVVLTTRPDSLPAQFHPHGKSISIEPLTREQILDFLSAQVTSYVEGQFEEIIAFLDSEQDLWRHLEVSLFVYKTAKYFVGDEKLTNSEEAIPILAVEKESKSQYQPNFLPNQENDGDVVMDSNLTTEVKGIVDVNEFGIVNYDDPIDLIDKSPNDESPPIEDKIVTRLKMGVFLNQVFEFLWEHNRKKEFAGFQCGQKDETFEKLGEMAARHLNRPLLRLAEVEQYLNGAIHCMLDLGILIKEGRGIRFPTQLSKSFFAAFFVDVLLETQSPDIKGLVVPPVTFWEKCKQLLSDIRDDITPFTQQLTKLKGE
mgnify:CR=1 FL=1